MAEKFNPSSFSAFLENVKPAAGPAAEAVSPMEVLKVVAASPDKRIDLPSLVRKTGISASQLANNLQELIATGMVTTEADGQTIILTANGEKVARLV